MLVLTRKAGQQIIIDDVIRIEVLEVRAGKVRLGIEAPPSVRIDRLEIAQKRAEDAATEETVIISQASPKRNGKRTQ